MDKQEEAYQEKRAKWHKDVVERLNEWSHTGAPCEMEQEIAEELLSQGDLTEVIVPKKPKCDFCNAEAEFDGRTVLGPWAYMCDLHFGQYGVGLGLGRGQKLNMTGCEEAEILNKPQSGYELVMYKVREPEVVYYIPFDLNQAANIVSEVEGQFDVKARLDGATMGGYMVRIGHSGSDYVFAFVREV